ncbi:hypothetical protein AYI69_g11069 [Smittium culicis]|uniref:Uncharacterized protein n=1 Tax=Smittium culicis TaxID=133412 RepID=A0A1R1X1D5_9FUNG|nr:hypothetical protein AYI69_g11069 [Smittium culicis]
MCRVCSSCIGQRRHYQSDLSALVPPSDSYQYSPTHNLRNRPLFFGTGFNKQFLSKGHSSLLDFCLARNHRTSSLFFF